MKRDSDSDRQPPRLIQPFWEPGCFLALVPRGTSEQWLNFFLSAWAGLSPLNMPLALAIANSYCLQSSKSSWEPSFLSDFFRRFLDSIVFPRVSSSLFHVHSFIIVCMHACTHVCVCQTHTQIAKGIRYYYLLIAHFLLPGSTHWETKISSEVFWSEVIIRMIKESDRRVTPVFNGITFGGLHLHPAPGPIKGCDLPKTWVGIVSFVWESLCLCYMTSWTSLKWTKKKEMDTSFL